MNQVGVKFLLQGGQWLIVGMSPSEAKALFQAYSKAKASGTSAPLTGFSLLGGERSEWIVWSDQVVAIHTFDPAQLQMGGQPPQPPGHGSRWQGSGLN